MSEIHPMIMRPVQGRPITGWFHWDSAGRRARDGETHGPSIGDRAHRRCVKRRDRAAGRQEIADQVREMHEEHEAWLKEQADLDEIYREMYEQWQEDLYPEEMRREDAMYSIRDEQDQYLDLFEAEAYEGWREDLWRNTYYDIPFNE